VTSPEVHELVRGYVDQLNATLGRWETIKRFEVLCVDLSVDDGNPRRR